MASRLKGVSFDPGNAEANAKQTHSADNGDRATIDSDHDVNPFSVKVPSREDISLFQEQQRLEKQERHRQQDTLKIHQRTTRVGSSIRRMNLQEDTQQVSIADIAAMQNPKSQELAIATRDRHIEKESMLEYIQKKRDMFLVQYALEIKRGEMAKLEQVAEEEENQLINAEKRLEMNGKKFYEFLKENDRASAEAVREAEAQTHSKLEKVDEIKALEATFQALESTLSKNDDRLQVLQIYIDFLDSLSPEGWEPTEETGPIYFDTPQHLLKVFAELEGHNLSVITNGQEIEETLQDTEDQFNIEWEAMETAEREALKKNTDLEKMIKEQQDLSWFAKERTSYFSASNMDKQEEEMKILEAKVNTVYTECIGENEANISALQMLTNIENKLEELFEMIAKMPPEMVEAAEKAKEKQRRLRAREEKLEAQRLHQADRVRKALERAQAAPKKQTGKRLVYRSAPPKQKKNDEKRRGAKSEQEEEFRYFYGE
eukprot:m.104612 g.104612  ORF g.104612 m.104612 type:complete len:488 (-) comp27579_c0_seq2:451-1914(-)